MYYNIIHNYSLRVEINELLIGKKMICSEDNIPLFYEVGFIRNKHHNGDRNIDIVNFKQQLDFFYVKN